ncbi:MAG: hypothetical protein QMC95_14120 [Desulfitobacteriaceae bacterium]|nr:hypothetical protein [Desulfitobacteriaceae bacterium]MDI6879784.1 hypothetical protein [Desulfitobacteriaceae bacterium]MDI6915331.1 hypothetical protein [Desulfitobacteriaceae bacterium]
MERSEFLRKQRERIMNRFTSEEGERAKLLVALMDIDDEMEEMGKPQRPSMPIMTRRVKREKLA